MSEATAHEHDDAPDLIPVRMLNEFVYCPRLAYLEWVQGEFEDNADTVEGRYRHRRVDRPSGNLPNAEDGAAADALHARSAMLSSAKLGIIARIDVVEVEGLVVSGRDICP
jgi:CRISPR-associated protein Cas1